MLIKIAFCEDNPYDQKSAEQYLQKWAGRFGHTLDLHIFSDSMKLIAMIDSSFEVFDVYLLDVEMNGAQEGIELAQVIRKQSEHVPIVFITSHRELAFKAFPVQALDFIVKPIQEDTLTATMNRVEQRLRERKNLFFSCTIAGTLIRIPLYEVLYIKSDLNYLLLNGDDIQRFRGKLSDAVIDFPDHLIICHQSYAVNIEHIRTLDSSFLTLTDGTEIPVSKSRLVQVRQQFADFYILD